MLETATRYGFARPVSGHWTLLPAVCRYLDHFEALAAQHREQAAELEEAQDDDPEPESQEQRS